MKVLFINNDGGGFADQVDVEPGTTVRQLFEQQLPDRKPEDYLIRVNRLESTADQELKEGDRVSMTPTKIEGAAARAS
jgi:cold shock CspA family protein